MSFPKVFNELIKSLSCFPGVGRRSAERIAFYILKMKPEESNKLINNIEESRKYIKPCRMCNNFSTHELCSICSNPKREKDIVCIVEEPKDIVAVEKTSSYRGLYFVLLGSLSPLEGVNEEDLNLAKLINRLEKGEVKEVIIATDSDTDGELTAQFLIQELSKYKAKVYRIGMGVPLGTQIEYIDSATLSKAFLERREVE
ncbi:MAG: recombination protein RecR [Candidatus Omnitrophica bacterium]|nr:recombination protein RecR [Candidatus Omnitrophota bacterium]MBD3269372.1 recombination protein RecR [Candidatus Omnitrophota bacterium]